MEIFGTIISATMGLFQKELTVFGYTFSFWQVFVFTFVAAILAFAIGGFFNGD